MQRAPLLLAAGAVAWLLLVLGCSNLTAPPGDDPRNLPQVADRGEPRPARSAASGAPGAPRIMRPVVPVQP
jgi:hypothetical protein